MNPATPIITVSSAHSDRLTDASIRSPRELTQNRHSAELTRPPLASVTSRLYPSKTLVRNRPPVSIPNELNTAGITDPIITTSPPIQMDKATNSTVWQTNSSRLVGRGVPISHAETASYTTRPSTSVTMTRPFTFHPAKGVFRLLDRNRAGSTSQLSCTSTTTTSASDPGVRVPLFNPKARAGSVVNFATASSRESTPSSTN